MMFEEEHINNIEIWVETRGKKADTYISGWNIDDNDMKEHLKTIKKRKGCNGSIKEVKKENNDIVKMMQFQGDIKMFVFSYLTSLGISEEYIKVKI